MVIPENSNYYFDVNHDGIMDFDVFNYSTCDKTSCWPVPPAIGIPGSLRKRSPYNLRSAGVEGHICCTLYALPRGAQVRAFLN